LSGIRTLPHQIEAVYMKMLPQPRLRFLLADDPGAGKTIMAGLFIKEMKLREAIDRILILCPAPLTIQWQDELLRWFNEPFDIIFSAVDQQQLVNPWQRASQVIDSLDYAKQDSVRERVWSARRTRHRSRQGLGASRAVTRATLLCGKGTAMAETRKLAAILAADVAGYSKLTGADEERTLARLRALRSDLDRSYHRSV
jgi:SNF2 family DNA or RNA helicase